MPECRACEVLTLPRASHRYRSVADEQAALRMRIRDFAQSRVSYDYRRLHILLQRESWEVNHKRVCRLYCQVSGVIATQQYQDTKSIIDGGTTTGGKPVAVFWSMR